MVSGSFLRYPYGRFSWIFSDCPFASRVFRHNGAGGPITGTTVAQQWNSRVPTAVQQTWNDISATVTQEAAMAWDRMETQQRPP